MTDLHHIPKPKSRQKMPDSAKMVFQGSVFAVYQWPQQLFNGEVVTFERLSRKDTVGIVAVTEDKKIIVSNQEQPSMTPFISLLGGVVDPGEDPFQAAQRELLEEAGGVSQRWNLWFSTQPITKIDWSMHIFIARDCRITQPQQLDGGEKIILRMVSFEEFLQLVLQPDFRDFEVALRVTRMIAQNKTAELKQILLGE